MSAAKKVEQAPRRRLKPATTPEARENQLISLAIDLAEEQLLNGTASAQVITHYLKLGSTKERLEKEMMEEQKRLLAAKTEALKQNQHMEELYSEALNAMKSYGSTTNNENS